MCRIFKIIYACGHTDVIKAPCEWRDEGRINIFGRHVHCENSTVNLSDLSRLCITCSSDPVGSLLIDLNSSDRKCSGDSSLLVDERDVMAIIVRNESYLRNRAKIVRVITTPPISLGFPTSSELDYQFCKNEEFLARRMKRGFLQKHMDRRGEYRDFLEAHNAHLDAKNELKNSIFTLEASFHDTTSTGKVQEVPMETVRASAADSSTQTDETEEAMVSIVDSSTQTEEIEETMVLFSPPSPAPSTESDDSSITISPSTPQEPPDKTQSAEWSAFIDQLSAEYSEIGRSRTYPITERIQLESPEGLARLADIRLFLGMRPDTRPLDIWNFAIRNTDLIANIADSTLPIRHRHLGQAQRPGFERDPGLITVSDYADQKWELRNGFIEVWNSLYWTREALSEPEPEEVPQSSPGDNTGGDNISAIDELCDTLNVNDFIVGGASIDNANVEDESEQRDQQERENNEEDEEEQTFQLVGRRARIPFEVDFSGEPRSPSHQAKRASRLRMSWTYADPENLATDPTPDPQTGRFSPLYLPPTPWNLQTETRSALSSNPPSLFSQYVPALHLLPSSLPATVLPDDALRPLSLDDSGPDLEEPVSPLSSDDSNPDPDEPVSLLSSSSTISSSSSSSSSSSQPPHPLASPDSARGQQMLSSLRRLLAIPASTTPQAISLFLDLHPELLHALRAGRVPLKKVLLPKTPREARQQESWARVDPRQYLRAQGDGVQRAMRAQLRLCLGRLDWDEIDGAPVPYTPLSPWDGYTLSAERDSSGDDAEEEEECEDWVRTTTVSPNRPNIGLGLAKGDGRDERDGIGYRVRRPSGLRTMVVRREAAQPRADAETVRLQSDVEEENFPSTWGFFTWHSGDGLSEPEVWDDVDLEVSFPRF